ncbi:tyrosine-type recombinase/integrase [Xenorhabdus bovienii]|uniref:tyrosine-type recombinase/integrase n=1 Tax=Xenorhabdus bovienii TaxID=40576 RepID=UPI0021579101|nr:site-specific integrase [Xenorhabdus bovienii]
MLTDTKLRKLHNVKRESLVEIPDGQGLSIRVTPKGMIVFQYRYRFNGKPRRLTLGEYGVISLKDARAQSQEARKLLSEGKDPIIEKEMRLEEYGTKLTVSDCVNEWVNSPNAQKLVKLKFWQRAIKRHVTDHVGKMIVDDMTVSHWHPVFKIMRDNDASTLATMMLSRMRQIFSYCIRIGKLNNNPLSELKSEDVGKRVKAGKRYFSDKEIELFWKAVDKTNMTKQSKLFIKLVLLTGCRGVELRLAKKKEFDLEHKIWSVPDQSSKTRDGFNRGLSNLAIKILKESFFLYPDLEQVFPPASIREDRPMAASVLLNMVSQVREVMEIDDWGMHDLRRTVKTKMSELGVLPHVSEKVLGHKLGGVLAVYDQHEYIKEQIEALELWANHILSCVK